MQFRGMPTELDLVTASSRTQGPLSFLNRPCGISRKLRRTSAIKSNGRDVALRVVEIESAGKGIGPNGQPIRQIDRRFHDHQLPWWAGEMEAELAAEGKARIFTELKGVLSGERGQSSYAEIGQRLGMSEGAMKVTVHRLRGRYRELLRLEIAQTVDSPEAVDDEIRHLFAALA